MLPKKILQEVKIKKTQESLESPNLAESEKKTQESRESLTGHCVNKQTDS